MSTELAKKEDIASVMELVVVTGDLSKLSPTQRLQYVDRVCESTGVNPLTQPFQYITVNDKLVLYATRNCTDQLRKLHGVSCWITGREYVNDVYIVTAKARDKEGREDESTGVVTVGNLKGDALANALMKCETKGKRRVTLSICGLGWLDETEIETIPNAQLVNVDAKTGEIIEEQPKTLTAALAAKRKTATKPKPDAPGEVHEASSEPNEPGEDDWQNNPTCQECGAVVEPHSIDGKDYSVSDQVDKAQTKFGRVLCWTCAKAASKREAVLA